MVFAHHGLWHGGGANRSDRLRYLFKVRLCPTVRQEKLWDTSDLVAPSPRPIFWTDAAGDPDHLFNTLMRREPWHEYDTGRLELLNRIRLWRYLTGDEGFDADYWLTRIENEVAR